jgi:hypothetical protein
VKFGDQVFSLSGNQTGDKNDPLVAWFRQESDGEIKLELIMGGLTNQQAEGAIRVCDTENLGDGTEKIKSCEQVEKSGFSATYKQDYANGAVFIKDEKTSEYVKVTNGRTISVLAIVLQYFLLTFGEVLLSTTALEFSYTQAPSSVKAISTALWYSTTALANVVVICLKSMESLSRDTQLLSSAGMVVAAMLMFIVIAWQFKVYSQSDIERLDKDDSDFLAGGDSDEIDTSRTPMINSNA